MKKLKLTDEEKEKLTYADIAEKILIENKKKMKIQDLFTIVINSLDLPESYFESKIGEFFSLLSRDKRFTMLEKGFWDLKQKHSSKVIIEDDDNEEELDAEEIEEDIEEEVEEDNQSYDDDDLDDNDDEYKDLVIIDPEDEQES